MTRIFSSILIAILLTGTSGCKKNETSLVDTLTFRTWTLNGTPNTFYWANFNEDRSGSVQMAASSETTCNPMYRFDWNISDNGLVTVYAYDPWFSGDPCAGIWTSSDQFTYSNQTNVIVLGGLTYVSDPWNE